MAAALLATRRLPPPDPASGAERLLGDVRAAIEAYRVHLHERDELEHVAVTLDWARSHPLVEAARRARRHRMLRIVMWPFMPFLRALRRRVLP